MKLFLRDEIKSLWAGRAPFDEVQKLEGEVYRDKEGRTTMRTSLNDRSYFLKIHRGIGWGEIFKNVLQLRLPIIGASNEYLAAEKLSRLDVDTLTTAAFGKRGVNPAKQLSFILTDDLSNTISLEDYCADWASNPPDFAHKLALIKLLADVSRTMHGAGINHRDYYICHFLLEKDTLATPSQPRCYLIDLHRAQLRSKVPQRWAVKDIAGLYFSAMDVGLSKRDCLRFVKLYSGGSLREALQGEREFWSQVCRRSLKLYAKDHGVVSPHRSWWGV